MILTADQIEKIKAAGWAAYCAAPTCRDMGQSKVHAAVTAAMGVYEHAAAPQGAKAAQAVAGELHIRPHIVTMLTQAAHAALTTAWGTGTWPGCTTCTNWRAACIEIGEKLTAANARIAELEACSSRWPGGECKV